MAISEHFLLRNLSGHVGRQLVFKHYGEKTVVSKYPDMGKRRFSQRQLKNQALMEAANEAAQQIMADKALRQEAQVRLNVTANKLYTALIKEYYANVRAAAAVAPA